jgi:hypothetical protein
MTSCEPWPVSTVCLPDTWAVDYAEWPDDQMAAMDIATSILDRLTAGMFRQCTTIVRPCRRPDPQPRLGLRGYGYPATMWPGQGWPGSGWPGWGAGGYDDAAVSVVPYMCGLGECGCHPVPEILLDPMPVTAVIAVKVDGTVLDPLAYRVDNWQRLVRVDGQRWPRCQNLTLPDSEVGTWSVTYIYGQPLPADGKLAVTQLAVEISKLCVGDDCVLSDRVVHLVREGVQIELDSYEAIREGSTGLPMVDRFIAWVNPKGVRSLPVAVSPDTEHARQTTWPTPSLPVTPPDSGGGTGGSFTYVQSVPTATWVIVHGLGFRPAGVRIEDNSGQEVVGEVTYPSAGVVRIDFAYAVSGTAYLS